MSYTERRPRVSREQWVQNLRDKGMTERQIEALSAFSKGMAELGGQLNAKEG